jgi:hypothetical protein
MAGYLEDLYLVMVFGVWPEKLLICPATLENEWPHQEHCMQSPGGRLDPSGWQEHPDAPRVDPLPGDKMADHENCQPQGQQLYGVHLSPG